MTVDSKKLRGVLRSWFLRGWVLLFSLGQKRLNNKKISPRPKIGGGRDEKSKLGMNFGTHITFLFFELELEYHIEESTKND